MKTRVHPALVQMLQFYGNYSFYMRKLLRGKVQSQKAESKQHLLSNAHNFILAEMSTYFRDMLSLPKKLRSTIRLYNTPSMVPKLANAKVAELLQFSNKIIYLDTGSKNPYFMLEEQT